MVAVLAGWAAPSLAAPPFSFHQPFREPPSGREVIRAQDPLPADAFDDFSDGPGPMMGPGVGPETGLGMQGFALPSIRDPGPDAPDFPDSAFAVPPGVVYIETSLTTDSSKGSFNGSRVRGYFTNTLVRIGLCEEWELRLSSPGVIQEVGPGIDTTGFGPLTFGFKKHIWEEDGWIPAFGIIAEVEAPTASAGFDDGRAVPTVFFNFDHPLPRDFFFSWNAGIRWLKGDDRDHFVQGEILWVISREVTPDLDVFVHGLVDFPSATGNGEEVLIGPGFLWFVTDQVALDFSHNFGLTDQSAHRLVRFGLSVAF